MKVKKIRLKKRQPFQRIKKTSREEQIFVILLALVLIIGGLNIAKSKGWLIPEQPQIKIKDGAIYLDSMSLEQKIAQMVIGAGEPQYLNTWKDLQLGGIHLFGRENANIFYNTILDFQDGMSVPFFVSVDLEGCINPFGYFHSFTPNSEIKTIGQAFEKGSQEGKFLRDLGITLNFAPVVDLDDQIWRCRAFPGDEQKVSELAQAYILGLQDQRVLATAKHYPGKTLVVKDPHKYIVLADIDEKDVYPYQYLFEKDDVDAVMVSHIIVSGAVDSEGVPSVVSPEILSEIKKEFSGLIVSDEIHMLGLQNFYDNLDDLYIAVFKAGNDIVINFDQDPNEVHRMIEVVAQAVEDRMIDEEQIDNSVRKVLEKKGFIVV